jgi:hypothetical protein
MLHPGCDVKLFHMQYDVLLQSSGVVATAKHAVSHDGVPDVALKLNQQ